MARYCGPALSSLLLKLDGMTDIDWNFQLAEQLNWHWRGQLRPAVGAGGLSRPYDLSLIHI